MHFFGVEEEHLNYRNSNFVNDKMQVTDKSVGVEKAAKILCLLPLCRVLTFWFNYLGYLKIKSDNKGKEEKTLI